MNVIILLGHLYSTTEMDGMGGIKEAVCRQYIEIKGPVYMKTLLVINGYFAKTYSFACPHLHEAAI